MKAIPRHIHLCRTANMSWRTCVVVKQIQSNPMLMQYHLTLFDFFPSFGCSVYAQCQNTRKRKRKWVSWFTLVSEQAPVTRIQTSTFFYAIRSLINRGSLSWSKSWQLLACHAYIVFQFSSLQWLWKFYLAPFIHAPVVYADISESEGDDLHARYMCGTGWRATLPSLGQHFVHCWWNTNTCDLVVVVNFISNRTQQ